MSSSGPKGLVRYCVAPAANPIARSLSLSCAVSITTGMSLVFTSALICQPQPSRLGDRLEPGVGAQLAEHRLDMGTQGRGRDAQRLGGVGRARPAREQAEHLELAAGERLDDLLVGGALQKESLQLAGCEE